MTRSWVPILRACFIRAPAWGATRAVWIIGCDLYVSIRAPAWGATPPPCSSLQSGPRFNPRPRVGGDTTEAKARGAWDVSIRAPAWGATLHCFGLMAPGLFQSAPPRGGRRVSVRVPWGMLLFQSAPPRGGRPSSASFKLSWSVFQSAPPRGGRPQDCRKCCSGPRFQSAPTAWGATGRDLLVGVGVCVSIRAPAWGATRLPRTEVHGVETVSIRAPAWGATATNPATGDVIKVSIRAPAWGATIGERLVSNP